jgi:hypothetical protein
MSEVINPPEYYFTGINFNPAFYNEAAGLSEARANALYLRKTVPDTATANETFQADINCGGGIFIFDSIAVPNAIIALESFPDDPTIQLTNSLGTMSINSNGMEVDASRTLNIGTNTNIDLNVGIGSRTISGQVHHYSDGNNCVAGAGVHLNNGTNNNSATNIHNGIGANATGAVNIMSGSANSGTITIGNETTNNTTLTLRGNTTITNLATALTPTYLPATITANQIGYSSPVTYTSPPSLEVGVAKTIASVSITAGVWYLMGHTGFPASPTSSYSALSISTVNNLLQASPAMINTQTHPTFTLNNVTSTIVTVSSTTTYYLTAQMNIIATLTDVYFQAVRIA